MKKLKYGLLLILTMILFSVPVLAAKTYYLPSKMEGNIIDKEYAYDKKGHMIKYHDDENDVNQTWKYTYDKNGKRVSGKEYFAGELQAELTFDNKQYLKTSKYVEYGVEMAFKWNKEGYIVSSGGGKADPKYTYYFKDGKLKKSAYYRWGMKQKVSYYDKNGLLSKTTSSGSTTTYEYKFNKNGLVTTIIKKTTDEDGKKSTEKINVTYSKTKTDQKTYALFINGFDTCYSNALL